MHNPFNEVMSNIVCGAMEVYNAIKSNLIGKRPKIFPQKSRRQPDDYSCGYYVMKHMHGIVTGGITNG
ncbi:unnamed protein product [Lathyrus oleraceus]